MMRDIKRYILGLMLTTTFLGAFAAQEIRLDEGWSIGGQVLSQGEHAEFTRRFQRGHTYFIQVAGDKNARDIDLQILDSEGRPLTQDIGSEKEAQVRFTPRKSGDYTIRLRLAKADARALCYFVVFRTDGGGWKVPQRDIETSLGRLATVTTELTSQDYRLQRFYGFVMRTSERQNIRISGLTANQYAVVAVGDDLAEDIDLAVFSKGRLLDSDELDDPVPITEFTASDVIEARVSYVSGTGPALVMMALFERRTSEIGHR